MEGKDSLLGSEEVVCETQQENFEEVSTKRQTFKWKLCGKIFNKKDNLKQHISIHSGLKEFNCHHSSNTFAEQNYLNKHLKIHTVRKEFRCHLCNKVYYNRSHLKTHLITHTGLKEYKCHLCSKYFYTPVDLKRHSKIHNELKEFQCHLCSKAFRTLYHLKRHSKIHSGLKEFKCHICSREFRQKAHLQTHLQIHTGIKEFKCHSPNEEFTDGVQLKQHMSKLNDVEFIDMNSSTFEEEMTMAALEFKLEMDPVLIKDEIIPKGDISVSSHLEETPSTFNSKELVGNECSVKVENKLDDEFQKDMDDSETIFGHFVKVEVCYDYDHEES